MTRGGRTVTFEYGPDRRRIRESGPGYTRTTVNAYFEKVETADGITYKHYIRAGSRVVAIHDRKSDFHHTTHYLHRDHLGSVDTITDKQGNVVGRMSFDAFGQRRQAANWKDGFPPTSELETVREVTTRGYTGHQMVDAVNLVYMGGRIDDPELGRFLSPDPNVPDPYNTQSYNRYSYVYNNPLSYTDPSGFVPKRDDDPSDREDDISNRAAQEMEECRRRGLRCVVGEDGQGQQRAFVVVSEVSISVSREAGGSTSGDATNNSAPPPKGPGYYFATEKDAALEALAYYNGISASEGREYGGYIFRVLYGDGETRFVYTAAQALGVRR